MYLNKRTHFLSTAIMLSAFFRLLVNMIEGLARIIINRSFNYAPDMLDSVLWKIHTVCSLLKTAAVIMIFFLTRKEIMRVRDLIGDDDWEEMGKLQKEEFGSGLSTLSADAIEQLILIWGVILGGAECVYFISTMIFRKFTTQLMMMAVGGAQYDSFVPLYNMSHGFKYLQMMTAIVLGIAMTGIFLRDRLLNISSGVLMLVFLLAFSVLQMRFITLPGRQIGIVWTSVVFHLTETVGLFALSVYISKHYAGL
ncbi:MAG: hypothetical protein IK139_04515 [Lachnospiraceae bacterium]|nr:hypothetical protein [Lachnospiraceae bacterium]